MKLQRLRGWKKFKVKLKKLEPKMSKDLSNEMKRTLHKKCL